LEESKSAQLFDNDVFCEMLPWLFKSLCEALQDIQFTLIHLQREWEERARKRKR